MLKNWLDNPQNKAHFVDDLLPSTKADIQNFMMNIKMFGLEKRWIIYLMF